MIKEKDVEDLFNKIKSMDTEPEDSTLSSMGIAVGKVTMKNEVLRLIQDWNDSQFTGKVTK